MQPTLLSLLIFLVMEKPIYAIDFFQNNIDYWEETSKPESKATERAKEVPEKKKEFDWNKRLDPKNDEFFQEGNHVPPAPMMELARDPSDENIRNWFKWINQRNKLMSTMQSRVQDYLKRKRGQLNQKQENILRSNLSRISIPPVDIKRFRFRMYFESSCPYCKKMMKTMTDLRDLGYYVEIKQIDKRKPDYPVPFPILPASPKEIQDKKIEAWPVLFVADTSRKQVVRINGYQNVNQVLKVVHQIGGK